MAKGDEMNDAALEMELSEIERLEFNRRKDIAWAVLKAAARLFNMRAEVDEKIKIATKAVNNYWVLGIGVCGLALQFILSGDNPVFDSGKWMVVIAVGYISLKQYEVWRLKLLWDKYHESLHGLEVTWISAIGSQSFWDISYFASDFAGVYGFEDVDAKFSDWWLAQRKLILENVCEYEKGRGIGKLWASR